MTCLSLSRLCSALDVKCTQEEPDRLPTAIPKSGSPTRGFLRPYSGRRLHSRFPANIASTIWRCLSVSLIVRRNAFTPTNTGSRGSLVGTLTKWVQLGGPSRARLAVVWPPARRDLQRVSLPRIDPASRREPTRPSDCIRRATAVCYLHRDVFIKRSALD
jgi:hypothetical protein